MRLWTVSDGKVTAGALVQTLTLGGGGKIPAVQVGAAGPGRRLGVLAVHLLPESYAQWRREGSITIRYATMGRTGSGRPKLIEAHAPCGDSALAVLRTPIGFRGSNDHTGDWLREEPKVTSWGEPGTRQIFAPFPGEIVAEGTIASGAAGRAGSGQQLIALMPCGAVFRTHYSGRLYDGPPSHYYFWDGTTLRGGLPWVEREVADLWPPIPGGKTAIRAWDEGLS